MSVNHAYSRRWWIVGAVLIGTWVGTLGNSMLPVALPSIVEQYGVGLDLGVWVISIYVLFVAALMPIFGWIGDRYGFRLTYTIGLAGLGVFSWAAALAPSFGWLIAFRALQGIFNATTLPSVMGIISGVFPTDQRGAAMGVWAAVNGAAHGLGPPISGFLVQSFGWPALFWLNGATVLVAVVLVYSIIPPDRKHEARPFDFLGASVLVLAMLTLMLALSSSSLITWISSANLILWLTFAVLMAVFFFTETQIAFPFVELRLFANLRYSILVVISSAQYFCLMGLPILLAVYLIQLRGFSSGRTGMLIAPLAITLAVFSPLAGKIADHFGFRTTIITGMAILSLAMVGMSLWTVNVPTWLIVGTLISIGIGMGLIQSPAATGVTLVVRKIELGVALGLFNMLRFITGTLGVMIFGIILERVQPSPSDPLWSFHLSLYLLAASAVVATLLAFLMPRQPGELKVLRDQKKRQNASYLRSRLR